MDNTFDWSAAVFAAVLTGYILAGVFVGRWMDEKFFDPCRIKKDTSWCEVLRALLWIFYLPVVALLVCKGVKFKYAPKSDYMPPKCEPYTGYKAEPNVSEVIIPEGVTELDGRAFHGYKEFGDNCFGLQHLVIPDTVTKIGVSAFQGCRNLTKVVIPESVKEICDCAFWECPSLAELHLPASLKKLGDAFDGSCYDGMDLYCHMLEPIPYGFGSDEGYPPNTHDRLFVPKGAKEKYEAAEPWNYYEIEYFEDERD